MTWVWIIASISACVALLLIVAGMSRHKKSATTEIKLIGSRAQVDSELSPEGTVLVDGELWRARSSDGTSIAPRTIVQVVGLSEHLLLVRRLA